MGFRQESTSFYPTIERIFLLTGEANWPVCTEKVNGINCLESTTRVWADGEHGRSNSHYRWIRPRSCVHTDALTCGGALIMMGPNPNHVQVDSVYEDVSTFCVGLRVQR